MAYNARQYFYSSFVTVIIMKLNCGIRARQLHGGRALERDDASYTNSNN